MQLKHRIAAITFLLVFLSAWVPSAVAHTVDPHHACKTDLTKTIDESDHCPYCDLQLSAFTPFQPAFFTVTSTVEVISFVSYISSASLPETGISLLRGPPVC